MMKTPLEVTQLYFDLSNQADLVGIEALVHPEATYSSVNTGLYYGIKDIMLMMYGFFENHEKLVWQIQSIEQRNDYITELFFECNAIKKNGENYQFSGVERLVVVDGLIRHIEVR